MKTLREMMDLIDGKVNENWVPQMAYKPPKKPELPTFGSYSPDDYIPPVLGSASVEQLDQIIADPSTKETTRKLAKKVRANKSNDLEENEDPIRRIEELFRDKR